MIRHQDNKIIFNEQVSFELPQRISIDPHPETCPSENELHLIAPDKSFKIVIAFLLVDKSAKDFTAEIYEERESVNIVHPLTEIEPPSGIKGWATRFEYGNEEVEEITLDFPGEPRSLLNLHFWHLKEPFDEMLYTLTKREILKSVRLLRDSSSRPVGENSQPSATGSNRQKKGQKSDPVAYIETLFLPNATVRVHYPDISEEERKRRMDQFKKAAADLIKAQIRADQERERKEREAQEKQQE